MGLITCYIGSICFKPLYNVYSYLKAQADAFWHPCLEINENTIQYKTIQNKAWWWTS